MSVGRTLGLAILTLLVAAGVGGAAPAEAKGEAWILTGGELGDYGVIVGLELDDSAAAEWVDAPASPPPGSAYTLFNPSGVFSTAAGPEGVKPIALYYPAARMVNVLEPAWSQSAWRRLAPDVAATVDSAIASGIQARASATAQPGIMAANWRWREMDNARYTFTPSGEPQNAFAIEPPHAEELAMQHIIETVSRPPVGTTDERPEYSITIRGLGQIHWGGPLGHYSPPKNGQPGKFWIEGVSLDGDNLYYETTPGLDAMIEERRQAAAAERTREAALAANRAPAFPGSTPADAPAAAVVAAEDDSSSQPIALVLLAAAGVALAGAGTFAALRRRR